MGKIVFGMLSVLKHLLIFLIYFGISLILIINIRDSTVIYGALILLFTSGCFHCLYYLFIKDMIKDRKSNLLFDWLETKNDKIILKEIIGEEFKVNQNTLINLEITQKKILIYVKYNKNKLELLKALMKTINYNYVSDLILRLFVPIGVALTIGIVSNPYLMKINDTDLPLVDSGVVFVIRNYVIILFIIFILIFFVIELYKGQRRNRLIEEIIETCIQKINDETKKYYS